MDSAINPMVSLIYFSRMSRGCTPADLNEIMSASRRNNEALRLTGALCYSPRGFLQCLEGPRDAVNEIFRRIMRDSRNEDVTLVQYEEISERLFDQWSMAYVRSDEVDGMILAKYGLTRTFDPSDLNAESALGFLLDISRERAEFLASQSGGV